MGSKQSTLDSMRTFQHETALVVAVAGIALLFSATAPSRALDKTSSFHPTRPGRSSAGGRNRRPTGTPSTSMIRAGRPDRRASDTPMGTTRRFSMT